MRPPRDLQKTDRTCPKCKTTFGAVADLCTCVKCGHSFYASRIRTKQVEPTVPSEIVRLLANVVSNADPEVVDYVERSIIDPKHFYKTNKRTFREWETSFDVDPIYAALHQLLKLDYVGCVDWRESSDEIFKITQRLIAKRNLNLVLLPFEFTKDVESADIVLNAIAKQFDANGISLCLFNKITDEYNFAILSRTAFEDVKQIAYQDFQVTNALALF